MATHFSILAWKIPWTEWKSMGVTKSQILQSPQAQIYFFSSSVSSLQSSELTLIIRCSFFFLKTFFFLHDENEKYQERKQKFEYPGFPSSVKIACISKTSTCSSTKLLLNCWGLQLKGLQLLSSIIEL